MTHSSVHIDAMRPKLHDLDWLRGKLEASEPIEPHAFPAGEGVELVIPQDWHTVAENQVVPGALIRTAPALQGGQEYPLTKAAILEAAALCGIPRDHQQQIPAHLLVNEVNWWYQEGFGDKAFKLLKAGPSDSEEEGPAEGTVMGLTRHTINPFSNLALLAPVLAGIEKQYGGGEVLVDYKFHHDLELTNFRLIVPGLVRTMTGTRVADDTWSTGINFRNSLIGLKPPELDGYLFRWWCTNGCYDTLSGQTASRRTIKDEADAVEWAAFAVDQVLGGLESTLDGVQELTSIPVEGDVSVVLSDLFTQHSVPRAERTRVLNSMADLGGDLTMYDVQNALTLAANSDQISPRTVDIMLRAGGHVAHAATGRCGSCRRVLPEGYVIPGQLESAGEAGTSEDVHEISGSGGQEG